MRGITGLVAAVAFALSTAATAATVTIDWNSPVFNPGGVGVGSITLLGNPISAHAGRFSGEVTSFTDLDPGEFVDSTAQFFAYCYDLTQTLSSSTYTVAFGADADVLNFLGAVNAFLPGGDAFDWLHPGNSTIAAAIQLGIWEGLYENNSFNLAAGNLHFGNVSAAVAAQFASFVALLGSSPDLDSSLVMRLTNERTQDVITGRREPERQIPEPGTLALLGVATIAAALAGRRKQQ